MERIFGGPEWHMNVWWWLWIGVAVAIRIPISGHDQVLWSDPKLTLFHHAKYEHPQTVNNLAWLLHSDTHYRSTLIYRKYISSFCSQVKKKQMAYIIFYLAKHHHANAITLETVQKFLSIECFLEGAQFHQIITGSVVSYLALVVPLRGAVENLASLPKEFLVKSFAKSHRSPLTLLEIRRGNEAIFPWKPETYFDELKDLVFLFNGQSIRKILPIYEESVMDEIFRPPQDLADIITTQVYLIHFVLVLSAHTIQTAEQLPLKLRNGILRESTIASVFNSDDCLCAAHKDDKCQDRMSMFAKAATQLEELVRAFCGQRGRNFNCLSLAQNTKSMSAILALVIKNSGLSLAPVMMVRLKFGLIALALIEIESYDTPIQMNQHRIVGWLKEAFLKPKNVPIADLRLLATIIWDHVQHYPDNSVFLDEFLFHLHKTTDFCLFLLDCPKLDWGFKKRFHHDVRIIHFSRQMELLPKLYVKDTSVLNHVLPEDHQFNFYLTLLIQNTAQKLSDSRFSLQDVNASKGFLKKFMPWLLDGYFICTKSSVSGKTYSRPKLSYNGYSMILALQLTLQTTFSLGVAFHEISFHPILSKKLQQIWSLSEAKLFEDYNFDKVILNKTR